MPAACCLWQNYFNACWPPSRLDKALDAYAEDAKQHLLESRSKERSSLSYRPVTNLCLKLVATTEQLGVVMFKIKSKLASGENNRSVEYSMVDSSLFSSSKALSIDPQRIALYFIILDSYFYRKIKPREFCNKAWTRKATAHMRAPAILKLVDIWNSRSFWVATQVLSCAPREESCFSFFSILDKT